MWGKHADLQAVLAVLAEAHKIVSPLLEAIGHGDLSSATYD